VARIEDHAIAADMQSVARNTGVVRQMSTGSCQARTL